MYHNAWLLSTALGWAGAGAAPQIGGKLAAGPWSSSTLDASAAAADAPVNHQVTLYWQSGPRWRGPVSLLMLGPAGAPCAPAVPWAHPWACAQHHGAPRRAHVAAEARSHNVPRLSGRAQRSPLATPRNACWRLAALPARATSGGGLSACARGCRWHSLRNNARASRADGAAAMPPLHYRAAGAPIAAPGAQALSGSAPAAARGLSLAPPWWGQDNRPCNGPGPVGPALII